MYGELEEFDRQKGQEGEAEREHETGEKGKRLQPEWLR
jgi:hypothetical protein